MGRIQFKHPDQQECLRLSPDGLQASTRCFRIIDSVIDLRPLVLDRVEKTNEDLIHLDESPWSQSQIFWKLLNDKIGHINQFRYAWLPKIKQALNKAESFLEVGGGLCYVSAMVKNAVPHLEVVASDISPAYLRQKSRYVPIMMGECVPNWYIALDAEHLPFNDNSVDIIWTHSSMHHFSNVRLFLNEALRVLSDRGVLIAIDTAIPWLFKKKHIAARKNRGDKYRIFEQPLTIRDWKHFCRNLSFSAKYVESKRFKGQFVNYLANSNLMRQIVYTNHGGMELY